jgi:WD40 repeat protein/serine/threonine protein kinase
MNDRVDQRYARAVGLFHRACEIPAQERDAFLIAQCAGDGDLLAAARAMVHEDVSSDDLLASAASGMSRLFDPGEELPMPERIGAYSIISVLGAGGMGMVFEAEQQQPRRRVALKVVRPGMATPRLLRRFELEAEALGRLQHAGIAAIHEAGMTETPWGRLPYLAMELIDGQPLDRHCEEKALPLRARVEVLARVCDALQHAHAHGVVHRDLKPTNVLVDSGGNPKLVDFGIARLDEPAAEQTPVTLEGQLLGTLRYMSPEQLRGDAGAIDARADVYAVGAIGYELIARRPPLLLDGCSLVDAARLVENADPPALTAIAPGCPIDLELIFAKSLEKERTRRYESAAALADDLRRFLEERPVLARPPSRIYRLRKLARRNRALVAGSTVAVGALLAGTAIATWKYLDELAVRKLSDAHAIEARHEAYRADVAAAAAALHRHDVVEAERLLDVAPQELRGWEWRHLRSSLDQSVRVLPALDGPLRCLDVGGDGRWIASAPRDGSVRVRDAATGEERGAVSLAGQTIDDLRFDPTSSALIVAIHARRDPSPLRVDSYALPALEPLRSWTSDVVTLASNGLLGAGGRSIAQILPDSRTVVLDLDRRERVAELKAAPRLGLATLSADARLVAFKRTDAHGFEVRRVADDSTVLARSDLIDVQGVYFDASASRLAMAIGSVVRIFDVKSGVESVALVGHEADVTDVLFSPDGATISTASSDGTVRRWDARVGSCTRTLHGHRGAVRRVAASEPGSLLATAGDDGTVRIWDADALHSPAALNHPQAVYSAIFSPDGRRIATGCLEFDGPSLSIWDAETREKVAEFRESAVTSLAFSHDGSLLAVGRHMHPTLLIDSATGRERASVPGHFWNTDGVAFDASDRRLVTTGLDGRLRLGDVLAQEPVREVILGPEQSEPIYRALWTRDGSRIVATRGDGSIGIYAADDLRELAAWPNAGATSEAICLSPDERLLAIGASNGTIDVRRFPTGEPLARLRGHEGEVFAIAFSPHGERMVSGGRDRALVIWNPSDWRAIARLSTHADFIYSLQFSPDGSVLLSGSGDATARLWDTRTVAELHRLRADRLTRIAEVEAEVTMLLAGSGDPDAAARAVALHPWPDERTRECACQVALGKLAGSGAGGPR